MYLYTQEFVSTFFLNYHKDTCYTCSAKNNKKSSARIRATAIALDLHSATVGLVYSALARQGLGCTNINLRTQKKARTKRCLHYLLVWSRYNRLAIDDDILVSG